MWAQLIKTRAKPGKEGEIEQLTRDLESGSGEWQGTWSRMFVFRNQNDPSEYYNLVVFESEEKARENERSPEQGKRLQRIQALFESPPEYVDLVQLASRDR